MTNTLTRYMKGLTQEAGEMMGPQCGGSSDQIMTWGGLIATFRWDNANNVDIKWFSVREIKPPLP